MRYLQACTGFPRPALKRKRPVHQNDKLPLTPPGFMCSKRLFFHLSGANAVRLSPEMWLRDPGSSNSQYVTSTNVAWKWTSGMVLSGIYVVLSGECLCNICLYSRLRTQSDDFPFMARDQSIALCVWARTKNLEIVHLISHNSERKWQYTRNHLPFTSS